MIQLNDLFIGKLLVHVKTGRDVRNALLRKNLLDKDADVKTMMDILHGIERTDLATKLEKCLIIG